MYNRICDTIRALNRYLSGIHTIPSYKIVNEFILEKGTIQHRLAQESLILSNNDKTPKDYDRFIDDGDLTLKTLYIDMCNAYAKEIRKEQNKQLRVLDD